MAAAAFLGSVVTAVGIGSLVVWFGASLPAARSVCLALSLSAGWGSVLWARSCFMMADSLRTREFGGLGWPSCIFTASKSIDSEGLLRSARMWSCVGLSGGARGHDWTGPPVGVVA